MDRAKLSKLFDLTGRAAHRDEMVGAALLLASDAGSFIIGQVIIADGGLTPH